MKILLPRFSIIAYILEDFNRLYDLMLQFLC